MRKSQRRAQNKRARRRRRKKGKKRSPPQGKSKKSLLKEMASWPLYECLLSKEWDEPGAITKILVARRQGRGKIGCAAFLVDLGCLGVKSGFATPPLSPREYRRSLKADIIHHQKMIQADLNLVAKIVREGVKYARSLGFSPDPDYRDALVLLGDADPDACDIPIPLGDGTGKPLYIAGPYDDVAKIVRKLTKSVGQGNFDYLVPIEGLGGEIHF